MRYSKVCCYGGSMDFFFASGDCLIVDSAAKHEQEKIKTGDIIAYLDWAESPLISVHRVLFKFKTREATFKFLTKGDSNLWFDPPVNSGQVIGKVVGIIRADNCAVAIDSRRGYAVGLLISVYSCFAVLAVHACETAAYVLQLMICKAQSAATGLTRHFPLAGKILPALLKLGLGVDLNRHPRLYSFFSWLPRKIISAALIGDSRLDFFFPESDAAQYPSRAADLAGNINTRLTLGGQVTICGDVTILPGAALVFQPGTQVRFAAVKSANGRVTRNTERGLQNFKNNKLCKIIVYGELICAGDADAAVNIGGGGDKWDSVVFLGRSRGVLENVSFSGSLNPLRVMDFSSVTLTNISTAQHCGKEFCVLSGCSSVELKKTLFYGIIFPVAAYDSARLVVRNCQFLNSETAIYAGGLARCRISHCDFSIFSAHACRISGGASLFAVQCVCAEGHVSFSGEGKSVMRITKATVKSCACGLRAESGSRVNAGGLIVERMSSHGLELHDSAVIYVKGGNISFCGGCAVFCAGRSGVFLDSVVIGKCGCGLAAGEGGVLRIKNSEITDITGTCVSCSSGSLTAVNVILLRAAAGFSVHSGSDADISGSQIGLMNIGVEGTGKSGIGLAKSMIRGCVKGVWIQDGSTAAILECLFENSAFAGIYADNSRCSAHETVFRENNIGVFTDHGGIMELSKSKFADNRTGVKGDNSSRITMTSSFVSGCAWDGIWCGGNAELDINRNDFVLNRYAIKEDGPCVVKLSGNKFAKSGVAHHLVWPRV